MSFGTGKIVIHAGFHKTGTSSVQTALRHNRARLKPFAALALKWRIREVLHAMRAYSTLPDPISQMKVSHRLDHWLREMPDLKRRGMIVSAEELAGHMPGREGIDDYGAAVALAVEIRNAMRRRYGNPDLHFLYTTRAPETWLESAYWEHVKSSSMTIDLQTFLARHQRAAKFSPVLEAIRDAVAPCPVTVVPIETCRDMRLGPAEVVLRCLGLNDHDLASFEEIAPANTRLPLPVLQELLDLNRNIGDRKARSAAKHAVIRRHEESLLS